MTRKRKTSPFGTMIELIAMLPWWIGVSIALVSYLVLHRMAASASIALAQPGQGGQAVAHTVISGLALAGQYLVPVFGLLGAAISIFCRRRRAALVADVSQSDSASALDGVSWREFELLVGESFRLQGYRVQVTGGGGPDGGVDLILTKGQEKFLVQCKQWKAFKVGVDVVRELYGVMAAKGAAGGFVVTSGRFTADASAFASGRNVQLVDGPKLFAMLKQAKQSTASAPLPTIRKTPIQATAVDVPGCPLCGAKMIKRLARKGGQAGGEFWGCTTFPACRGVRQLN